MLFDYGERYYAKREGKLHYLYMASAAVRLCEVAGIECRTAIDVGCASGVFLKRLRSFLPEAVLVGVDCGRIPRKNFMLADDKNASFWEVDLDKVSPDLAAALNHRFDFVSCVEVIEHIDPKNEANLVAFISGLVGGVMMFTGAAVGQKGFGHVNCQDQDHWVEAFAKHGVMKDEKLTETGMTVFSAFGIPFGKNLIVFKRT